MRMLLRSITKPEAAEDLDSAKTTLTKKCIFLSKLWIKVYSIPFVVKLIGSVDQFTSPQGHFLRVN